MLTVTQNLIAVAATVLASLLFMIGLGTIEVRSVPGKGATVHAVLPLEEKAVH